MTTHGYIQNTDAKSIECLIAKHGRAALGYALKLTGDHDSSCDLVQDALCHLLNVWNRYDRRRPLKPWFFSIMKNRFLARRRQNGHDAQVSLEHPVQMNGSMVRYSEILKDGKDYVLDCLLREETIRLSQDALRNVRSKHRDVLRLCDVERRKYREAARILKVPLGTVRSRLYRARVSMRREYAKLEGLPC